MIAAGRVQQIEDARRDRIYLPLDDMNRYGVSPTDVLRGKASEGMRSLLRFQVARARSFYSQAMRKLTGNLNRTQTLCLFTNQIREKVGVMFGSPETQPGGRALKFYSSQRLDIRRIETLKDGTEAVGNRVRVKVVKNKVAAPFRQAEFDIEFGKGISSSGCILDLGIEHDIVQKSGSFFSYDGERLGQGRNNAKAFLDEHRDMAKEIEGKIYAALGIGADTAIEAEPIAVPDGVDPETGEIKASRGLAMDDE